MLLGDPEEGWEEHQLVLACACGFHGVRALAGSARLVFALLPCLPLKRNARSWIRPSWSYLAEGS